MINVFRFFLFIFIYVIPRIPFVLTIWLPAAGIYKTLVGHLSNTTVCTIMIIYLIKCKNSFNLKKNDEKWHFLGVLQKIIKNNQRIIKKRMNFICKILRYSFVHIKDLTDELVVCKCLKVCSIAYLEVASICTCKKKTFATLPYFFQIKRIFKLPSRCNRWLIKYWLWFLWWMKAWANSPGNPNV